MATRAERNAAFHLGWAAIVIAFLIAAALATDRPALAGVFGFAGVVGAVAWASMSGWRLRGPVWRLPPKPTTTEAENVRRASARKVRDEFNQLFHARAKPALDQLRRLTSAVITDLRSKPEPYQTTGQLAEMFALTEVEDRERGLRRALEGAFWKELEEGKDQQLAMFAAEMDLDKRTAEHYAGEFYNFYASYRLLIPLAEQLARLVGTDPTRDARFADWRGTDREFTTRLREVLALPELASYRSDFEKWIGKWS